jgi:hypothetical protein
MDTPRPGPKPRGPFDDKRKTLTTRITEETRTKLEAATAATGRSLSQEIEFRLERSFQTEEAISAAGPRTQALLRALANQTRLWKGEPDSWLDDPAGFNQVSSAWHMTIDAHQPPICQATAQRFEEGRQAVLRLARGNYEIPEQRTADEALCNFLAVDPSMPQQARNEFRRFMIRHLAACRTGV